MANPQRIDERPLLPPASPLDRALEVLDRARGHPLVLVVGITLAAVVGVIGWSIVAPDRTPVEQTLPPVTVPVAASTIAPPDVAVHIAGAVAQPGLYLVGPEDRVADLVARAGGGTDTADLSRVNLAARVVDGTQIYVPELGEPAPPGLGAAADAAGQPVDLNLASPGELESLPGIGPALSAAIVDHRDSAGPFVVVDDLLAVSGIGPAKLDRLRELVVVR